MAGVNTRYNTVDDAQIVIIEKIRLCLILVEKENHVFLFSSDISRGVAKKIMEITNVKVSEGDGLPSVVCPSCFAQLELSHQFKLQVEKADKILRDEISVNAVLPTEDEGEECEVENEDMETDNVFKEVNSCKETENVFGVTISREEEENSLAEKHDTPEEVLNRNNEDNNKHVSGSEPKASHEEGCNSVSYNNSAEKKIKHMKRKAKAKIKKDSIVYRCEVCDKSYKVKQMFEFHSKIHYEGYKCDLCSKAFLSKQDMKKHRRIHSVGCDEHRFSCEHCGKSYKHEIGLKSHINYVHINNAPLLCTQCGKAYKTISGLHFHRKTKHSKNGPLFVCEICGKRFMEHSSLCSHKKSHENKPVNCEVCNKTYPHTRALMGHKRSVHQASNRFCCDVCGKYFKHNATLKTHREIHSGQKPHVCNICGFAFTQKSAMRTHMKVHTGLEPYSCQHCDQRFKWKQTFDKHVLKCSRKQNTNNAKSTDNSNVSSESSSTTD